MCFKNLTVSSGTLSLFLPCTFWPFPKLVDVVNRKDKLNSREEEWAKVEPETDVKEAKYVIELE